MNTKAETLRGLVSIFQTLIKNINTDDEFDFGDGSPVDRHTDWDSLPNNSTLTVFSLNGNNAPDAEGLAPKGFVLTFSGRIGGHVQLYINGHMLAVRKIGDPAGWAYLGLDSHQKIYMDGNTAQVLNDITNNLQYHDYVTVDSPQEISGKKDFDVLPLFNGHPLVQHHEFEKLTGYVRDNFNRVRRLHSAILDNSDDITLLSNDYHDVVDNLSNNYVPKSELGNYAPLSQLDYYVPKKALGDYVTKEDLGNASGFVTNEQLTKFGEQFLKQDALAPYAKQSDLDDLDKKLQADIKNKPTYVNLMPIKQTIHRMNIRYQHFLANHQNEVTSLANLNNGKASNASLSSLATSENNVNNSNSNHFNQIATSLANINQHVNQHDLSVDQSVAANKSSVNSVASSVNKMSGFGSSLTSLSNSTSNKFNGYNQTINGLNSGVSENATRLNFASTKFQKLDEHNKKSDRRNQDRYTGLAHSASANAAGLSRLNTSVGSVSSVNASLSSNVSQMSSGVSANAKRLNGADSKFYAINQHEKKADKINDDAVKSLATATSSYSGILTNHANNINSLFSSTTSLSNDVAVLNNSLPAGITSNAKEITLDGNTLAGLSSGVSANASRLNSAATETANMKQHMKRANKRYEDAISSLSAANKAKATDQQGVASLSNSVSVFSGDTKIDIQSLANKIKSVASNSADSKINSVVTSDKAVIASQSNTNESLSNAIVTNSEKTSNVENALISALSKNQLR